MHALRVSACSYCNCYNISRGTWCASERAPTDVAVNLWLWETVTVRQRKKLCYQLQCWPERLRAQDQSFAVLDVLVCRASLYLYSDCYACTLFSGYLLHNFVISSLRLMWSDISSCYCTLIYARQGVDTSCPSDRQYNYSCIVNSIIV